MGTFQSNRVSKKFEQLIKFNRQVVFPLICPVREEEWVNGWKYKMIYSGSGFIEKGCTYSTASENGQETIWYVTIHDDQKFIVEFLRITPGKMIVRTTINLQDAGKGNTLFGVANEYTLLNGEMSSGLENELDDNFNKTMAYFGASLTQYLEAGAKLKM